ncbi:hypothetical protein PoB_005646300 [Plakobranchus ocellatus]|uniref:Uncharacterized protein n=1 Tax=Plakobranchus ocellatus TaxID=259542 RepID=A0AAV4CEQ1_9GAST|nr:hypothetical protein PoB_005646300 [Plakobranchus ocellatus]
MECLKKRLSGKAVLNYVGEDVGAHNQLLEDTARVALNTSPQPPHAVVVHRLMKDMEDYERVGLTFHKSLTNTIADRWRRLEDLKARFLQEVINMEDQINDDISKSEKQLEIYVANRTQTLVLASKHEQLAGLALHTSFYKNVLDIKIKSLESTYKFLRKCTDMMNFSNPLQLIDRYEALKKLFEEIFYEFDQRANALKEYQEEYNTMTELGLRDSMLRYNEMSDLYQRFTAARSEKVLRVCTAVYPGSGRGLEPTEIDPVAQMVEIGRRFKQLESVVSVVHQQIMAEASKGRKLVSRKKLKKKITSLPRDGSNGSSISLGQNDSSLDTLSEANFVADLIEDMKDMAGSNVYQMPRNSNKNSPAPAGLKKTSGTKRNGKNINGTIVKRDESTRGPLRSLKERKSKTGSVCEVSARPSAVDGGERTARVSLSCDGNIAAPKIDQRKLQKPLKSESFSINKSIADYRTDNDMEESIGKSGPFQETEGIDEVTNVNDCERIQGSANARSDNSEQLPKISSECTSNETCNNENYLCDTPCDIASAFSKKNNNISQSVSKKHEIRRKAVLEPLHRKRQVGSFDKRQTFAEKTAFRGGTCLASRAKLRSSFAALRRGTQLGSLETIAESTENPSRKSQLEMAERYQSVELTAEGEPTSSWFHGRETSKSEKNLQLFQYNENQSRDRLGSEIYRTKSSLNLSGDDARQMDVESVREDESVNKFTRFEHSSGSLSRKASTDARSSFSSMSHESDNQERVDTNKYSQEAAGTVSDKLSHDSRKSIAASYRTESNKSVRSVQMAQQQRVRLCENSQSLSGIVPQPLTTGAKNAMASVNSLVSNKSIRDIRAEHNQRVSLLKKQYLCSRARLSLQYEKLKKKEKLEAKAYRDIMENILSSPAMDDVKLRAKGSAEESLPTSSSSRLKHSPNYIYGGRGTSSAKPANHDKASLNRNLDRRASLPQQQRNSGVQDWRRSSTNSAKSVNPRTSGESRAVIANLCSLRRPMRKDCLSILTRVTLHRNQEEEHEKK